MRRPTIALLLLILLSCLPALLSAQVTPTLIDYSRVQTNGLNSTYSQGLTHRYVGEELRLLTLALGGVLQEFRPAAPGQLQMATTNQWNLSNTGALNDFTGFWFEQAKNRLWVTSSRDYTNVNNPAKVTLLSLGAAGTVTVLKQFYLSVPSKLVYGGCNAVPPALVAHLGGPYVCGWGGYTSLVEQGGGASVGPTMFSLPDPDTVANGSTVKVRTILDASDSRGVRKTIPINYFDGGDPRQNPPTRPTSPPVAGADWLSPNAQGLGWMVWGDSYYNTGVWIGTTYAAVMSGAKGAAWYQSSTLAFDGRQFELHSWDGTKLGSNILQRPDTMTELTLPVGNSRVWSGNIPTGNISGATYDARTATLYMVGWPFDADNHEGRLYRFSVGAAPAPGPTPTPDPEPEPDTTPPAVSITSPANGAVISGQSTFVAEGDADIVHLDALLNGAAAGSIPLPGFPLNLPFDTVTMTDGVYRLQLRVRDSAGNVGLSSEVSFTVQNAVPPPPGPIPEDPSPSIDQALADIQSTLAAIQAVMQPAPPAPPTWQVCEARSAPRDYASGDAYYFTLACPMAVPKPENRQPVRVVTE